MSVEARLVGGLAMAKVGRLVATRMTAVALARKVRRSTRGLERRGGVRMRVRRYEAPAGVGVSLAWVFAGNPETGWSSEFAGAGR